MPPSFFLSPSPTPPPRSAATSVDPRLSLQARTHERGKERGGGGIGGRWERVGSAQEEPCVAAAMSGLKSVARVELGLNGGVDLVSSRIGASSIVSVEPSDALGRRLGHPPPIRGFRKPISDCWRPPVQGRKEACQGRWRCVMVISSLLHSQEIKYKNTLLTSSKTCGTCGAGHARGAARARWHELSVGRACFPPCDAGKKNQPESDRNRRGRRCVSH